MRTPKIGAWLARARTSHRVQTMPVPTPVPTPCPALGIEKQSHGGCSNRQQSAV